MGRIRGASLLWLAAAAATFPVTSAEATEGYFQHGYGARYKALGGAGAADSRDATAAALNPAGLVHVGNEASIAVSAFSPHRSFEGGGQPGFTPDGLVESDSNLFFVPNLAANYRFAPNPFVDVVAFTVYGNGGMNTDYAAIPRQPGGTGVFFDGKSGVDLEQALISVAFAKQFGPFAVGVAPILARQQFEADGLGALGVTDDVTDVSWGYGVRGGIEFSVTPSVRLGVAGSSRIWSEPFENYKDLFAEHGDFDIPPSLQAGIAIDATPNVTLLADYRHIWFGSVKSIANPSTNPFPLGPDNGPGFGWDDVDVVKVGVEWRSSPTFTLRGGYSYATGAIDERDVEFNILAPAVVHHHFSAGFEYQLTSATSFELAGLYAPEETLSGVEIPPGNPGHTIDISMHQYEVTAGLKYRFAPPPAPLK